jgi:cytosine/adenosine deaminase-related metal-dependent hydrolase
MLITNGTLITWEQTNRILEGQAVYLMDGKIEEIGPQEELLQRYPQAEKLDAGGQYVMPGNLCAHTHFYGAFARGGDPGPAPATSRNPAECVVALDKSLDLEAVRLSAEVMLVDDPPRYDYTNRPPCFAQCAEDR